MTSLKPLLPSHPSHDRLEMTKEECEEFVKSLKGLESTMRDHLQALAAYVTSSKKGQPIASELSLKPGQGAAKKQSDPIMKKIMTAPTGDVAIIRKEKVTIHVKIVFLKVGEIDTLRDRFAADAYVQAKWREPALDGKLHIPVDQINWDNYWNPKLLIDNIFGDPKETIWHSVLYDSSGLAMVSQKRRVNGSFLEYMELNQFPFDTQDLTVSLTSERSNDEIEFVEDVNDKCALNVESFVDEQEWKLHKVIHTWTRTREESFQSTTCFHPVFSAACKASRRPEFFIWNILVVMFLICTLSFATFAVQVHLPQNRLQLSFILLLTTVSFKFVVNQSLPMISYLTYLDKYILSSMAILCCICVWHAVAISIYNKFNETVANAADRYAIGILGSIYFIFHLIFIISIACLARENLRMTRDKEQEAEKGQNNDIYEEE